MTPWALVPVKGFARGKSRLGELLDDGGRAALAQAMFDRVVGEVLVPLVAAGELGGVVVLTDAAEVLARAAQLGATAWLAAPTRPGRPLSAIVDEGLARVAGGGAGAGVVLMGDLPALRADDVRALVALLDRAAVVIAPDEAQAGTNALALRLPAPMPTCFCGGASLAAHRAAAEERGLAYLLCDRPGLRFDVDQPEDYARLRAGSFGA